MVTNMLGKPVITYKLVPTYLKIVSFAIITSILCGVSFVSGMIYLHETVESKSTKVSFDIDLPIQSETVNSVERVIQNVDEPTYNINWEYASLEEEIDCLAKNIYFETRNQNINGKLGNGLVTINRILSSKYPQSVCDVVWQKRKHPRTGKWVAQFSWTLDGKTDEPKDQKSWKWALTIASAFLAEGSLHNFYDITNGATHYHADYVNPYWNKVLKHTVTIENHIFYRDTKALPVAFNTISGV